MSIVFTARKEKRPRTSSNETNTSFVQNVTSRVSGLLPATIARWFSSPSSSNTNGSAPTVDATDSSTEDEGSESPVVTQPQAKRMRFSSPNNYQHFSPTDANCSTSSIEITEMPVTPYPGTQFSTRSGLTLTPIRTLTESISNESIKNKNERENSRFKLTQRTTSGIGHSIAAKRKSIFVRTSVEDKKAKTTTKPSISIEKKPYFKPRLLGSPFYPGMTMYGGAASSYVNQANIQQHTVAYVNDTKNNEDSVMSSSTRRIMDLLEQYSSPLREARRIPTYTCPQNKTLNSSADRIAPNGTRNISYKMQELCVPNIASILRVKQKSRLMDTTKTARQIIASHSSAQNYQMPYPSLKHTTTASNHTQTTKSGIEAEKEQSNKMTTKVKANVTRTNRGKPDHVDLATPVKLPAAILPIDQNNLPKFAFDTPALSKLPAKATPQTLQIRKLAVTKTNADVSTSKPVTVTSSSPFKFSNPVRISGDNSEADTTPPKFTFDSPERRIEQNSDIPSVVGNVKETDKTTPKTKNWQCPDCWVDNKADAPTCICCGYKSKKAAKCVVCKLADSQPQNEKCAICVKMTSPPAAKSQSSKWKCEDCWVPNEASVNKCACCGTVRPTAEQIAARASARKAKPKTEAFKCGGCFSFGQGNAEIQNKETKPLPLSQTPNLISSFGQIDKVDSAFKTIAQSQKSEKWECSSCLVRNESDKSECVCCGTEREPKSKLPQSKFNFGLKTNTSFNFGIDPKVQETTIANKSETKTTTAPKSKEKSETNNNVLAETPAFTFTLPAKKVETKVDAPKAKAEEPPKFSFGIPKDASSLTKKSVLAKVTDEDNEKPQEVPVVNFTSIAKEAPKPGVLFASPLIQQAVKDNPLLPASNLFSTPTADAKKDITSAVVPVQPLTSNIDKPQGKSAFTLGSSTLNPSSSLFGAPATGSSSANLFTAPAQSTAVTTSSSTVPSLPPAQKSETTSSVVPAIAAPLFSFGNPPNMPAATAAPMADKPKFQFTFGSNIPKPDAAPAPSLMTTGNSQLFKSPFGSAPDNNAKNTCSFGISGGVNTLGANNTLGGSNGLATTNSLTGNTLSESTLGSNPLRSSNTLGGNTLGGNTLGGNTLGGNTLGGNTIGGNTLGGNTIGGNTIGGNTLGGNTLGSNTLRSNTMGVNPLGGNTLGGALTGNGLSNNILGGNLLGANSFSAISTSANTLGNSLPSSTLASNSMQINNTNGSSNIFGSPVQKENMWNSNNNTSSTNLFVSNAPTNNLQKAPTFTFGASTQFNTTSPPPAFSAAAQPSSNIFGMGNQNNNRQLSPFSNPTHSQSPAPMFGSPQPTYNQTPQMSMFGTTNMSTNSTFGVSNPTIPSFETSMTPVPAPAFNFGAPSQAPGIFGFGQQQMQQQPQQSGVYSFGGTPAPPVAQVQFNMGTAPAGRRLRKAVRRTTQR